ncbi:glycosyltransferase family 4 protein [Marinobacterium jannaschii]|uniref:glycosyltransferase family 4 protein n=1 Tax=Marinobacterium jannaschii TaxID=64970 RepID=UPI00048A3A18|nr:glycosyltransferase family 4 protein [Marinobacterium jannaschii]
MKVIQVLPALDGGGVEKGTLEVARALVDAGHESVVVSGGGRMVAQLEAEGSRHREWDLGRKSPLTLLQVRAVRRWLRAEKADILHLRSRMPAWIFYLAWKGLPESERPGLVTTVHGLYSVSAYSEVMCKGERVIAVSETVRDYIRTNYPGTDMDRVRLIYRGIDPEEFPRGYQPSPEWLAEWRQQYPQLAGKKVLTLPGRLTRLKGHNDFIDLIIRLKADGLPVHGLIVGGEDPKRQQYAQELRQRIKIEGLEGDITFTGARRDIRDIYAMSDLVFSLSTKPESFGRTTLEALAMGTPVIGYDHGGVGEILSQLYSVGKTPLKDIDALQVQAAEALHSEARPLENHCFLKTDMLSNTLKAYGELCQ